MPYPHRQRSLVGFEINICNIWFPGTRQQAQRQLHCSVARSLAVHTSAGQERRWIFPSLPPSFLSAEHGTEPGSKPGPAGHAPLPEPSWASHHAGLLLACSGWGFLQAAQLPSDESLLWQNITDSSHFIFPPVHLFSYSLWYVFVHSLSLFSCNIFLQPLCLCIGDLLKNRRGRELLMPKSLLCLARGWFTVKRSGFWTNVKLNWSKSNWCRQTNVGLYHQLNSIRKKQDWGSETTLGHITAEV